MGIDNLLEMVVLTAEMRELKANPNRSAHGAVIEARLDKGRGPVATLLVQNGTLQQGDVIIAGTAVGRVRAMTDARGQKVTEAGPSVPVEIIGMGEVPGAGDDFHAVADERMARELVEQRKHEQKMAASAAGAARSPWRICSARSRQGEMKDLNIIVKADVQGSAEAVKASLEKLSNEEVRVRVIHCAVGAINESRRHAGLHLQRHHRGLQCPPRRQRQGLRRPRRRWICGCTGSSTTASTRWRPP